MMALLSLKGGYTQFKTHPKITATAQDLRDNIFNDVVEIIHADNVDYLLAHTDPDILVREYYGGSRFDDDDHYPA